MNQTTILSPTMIWVYVALGMLIYFYIKIKKQYTLALITEPKLTILTHIGRFLKTDIEDLLLSIGTYLWLLTGHSIGGFEVNTTSEVYCVLTGIAIPYTAVNIVLGLINAIPVDFIKTGNRSQKRIEEKISDKV